MKNWLPLVFGPEFAIAIVPARYSALPAGAPDGAGEAVFSGSSTVIGRFSSANWYAGPPLPVPLGSPHCSTNAPDVVSRWQGVLSKYCLPARNVKLAAEQGAFAVSMVA